MVSVRISPPVSRSRPICFERMSGDSEGLPGCDNQNAHQARSGARTQFLEPTEIGISLVVRVRRYELGDLAQLPVERRCFGWHQGIGTGPAQAGVCEAWIHRGFEQAGQSPQDAPADDLLAMHEGNVEGQVPQRE